LRLYGDLWGAPHRPPGTSVGDHLARTLLKPGHGEGPLTVARPGRVLLVDDDLPFLLSLTDGLATWAPELEVVAASSGAEALQHLADGPVDVLATDLRMPGVDGVALVERARRRQPDLPVVVITAVRQPELESRLDSLGPLVVLDKPLDLAQLVAELRRAVECAARPDRRVSHG